MENKKQLLIKLSNENVANKAALKLYNNTDGIDSLKCDLISIVIENLNDDNINDFIVDGYDAISEDLRHEIDNMLIYTKNKLKLFNALVLEDLINFDDVLSDGFYENLTDAVYTELMDLIAYEAYLIAEILRRDEEA